MIRRDTVSQNPNSKPITNLNHFAVQSIIRDKETAMKVMAKYMKTDNRRLLEAVYNEHEPVFKRVPLMTKEDNRPLPLSGHSASVHRVNSGDKA